jgi:negative regulator of flagellin synthesis FlgM
MVRDVNGINGPRSNATPAGNNQQGKAVDAKTPENSSRKVQEADDAGKDTVEISSQARVLKNLEGKLSSLPDVNIDRVAEIRAAIEDGTFTVDADSIADKIILSDGELE